MKKSQEKEEPENGSAREIKKILSDSLARIGHCPACECGTVEDGGCWSWHDLTAGLDD